MKPLIAILSIGITAAAIGAQAAEPGVLKDAFQDDFRGRRHLEVHRLALDKLHRRARQAAR